MARTEVGPTRPKPPAEYRPEPPAKPQTVDSWMGGDLIFSALVIKRQSLILFLLRLPAFIPWIFVARGWLSLNEKDSLTNTEADILGTGGEICLFVALSITPLWDIYLTGVESVAAAGGRPFSMAGSPLDAPGLAGDPSPTLPVPGAASCRRGGPEADRIMPGG